MYSQDANTAKDAQDAEADSLPGEENSETLNQENPREFSPGATTFTFVNAHLAAFDDMVEKRHSDFQDLSRRLTFVGGAQGTSGAEGDANDGDKDPLYVEPDTGAETTILSVYDTDVLFWHVRPVFSLLLTLPLTCISTLNTISDA